MVVNGGKMLSTTVTTSVDWTGRTDYHLGMQTREQVCPFLHDAFFCPCSHADALARSGRRAVLLQQIEAAASGAHGSMPRSATAASGAEAEANWWGLADLWETMLMDELRRREQRQQQDQV